MKGRVRTRGARIAGGAWLVMVVLGLAGCDSAAADGEGAAALDLTLHNIHTDAAGARDVAVHPDGRTAAVTASAAEGSGIWVVSLELPEASQLWEAGSSPAWSPDGSRLAFVRGGELWSGDPGHGDPAVRERGAAQSGTGEPGSDVPVSLTTDFGDVRAPAWSPDGRTIAFYSGRSGHQDVWLVPADGSGEPERLTEGAMALDDGRFALAWSPDGRTIAYISNEADYWHDDVWLLDVETRQRRQASRGLMASSTPVWSPDGSRIALFGTAKDEYWYQDLAYIYVLDAAGGTERIVAPDVWASDFIMRHRPAWSADGSLLYFPYHERGAFDLWSVPAAGGVATRITNVGGQWRSLDAAPDGSGFAFVRAGPTEGAELWYVPAAGGPERAVTSFAAAWRGLQAPREVAYRSFDGLYIQGFLFLPPGAAEGRRCPALVQVHGGGTNSYYQGLNLTEQYLASRGFVVLAINYRGGSGFGRAFQDLAVEDWLNEQALDAGAAADWLRTLPEVNGKVGIYGGSYGGSMSLAAATRTPDKFDAVVPMRGAYSKRGTLEYTDRLGIIFTVTGHGGTPEERPDTYDKSATVDRLERLTAPVLLMHGTEDRRVPIQHLELAAERLEELGKEYEVATYPEGHGFRNPENRIDMYERLESFFERHLGTCEGP